MAEEQTRFGRLARLARTFTRSAVERLTQGAARAARAIAARAVAAPEPEPAPEPQERTAPAEASAAEKAYQEELELYAEVQALNERLASITERLSRRSSGLPPLATPARPAPTPARPAPPPRPPAAPPSPPPAPPPAAPAAPAAPAPRREDPSPELQGSSFRVGLMPARDAYDVLLAEWYRAGIGIVKGQSGVVYMPEIEVHLPGRGAKLVLSPEDAMDFDRFEEAISGWGLDEDTEVSLTVTNMARPEAAATMRPVYNAKMSPGDARGSLDGDE